MQDLSETLRVGAEVAGTAWNL